ncbi:hypothetical protein HZC07_01750, partial [Candidatus Micrarchaeota archaeon]|nr:hypothetical protein [Candidatus Micrarchaeota archaeon]
HYLGTYGLLETIKLSSPSPKPINLFVPGSIAETFERYEMYAKFAKITKIPPRAKVGTQLYHSNAGNGFTVNVYPIKHCKYSYGFVFQENDKIKFHEEKAHALGLKGTLFREIQKKGKVKLENGKEVRLEDVSWVQPGRKVVYTGDAVPDTNTIEVAKGADLLIHEGTFDSSLKDEAIERLHSTVEDAATIAQEAGVKRLIITHISPRHSSAIDIQSMESQAKAIFTSVEIANDGKIINL